MGSKWWNQIEVCLYSLLGPKSPTSGDKNFPLPPGTGRGPFNWKNWSEKWEKRGISDGSTGQESTCQCRSHRRQFQFLGQEDPLEEEMATYSSILTWKIPWTEDPGELESKKGLQRVRHNWVTKHTLSRSRNDITSSAVVSNFSLLRSIGQGAILGGSVSWMPSPSIFHLHDTLISVSVTLFEDRTQSLVGPGSNLTQWILVSRRTNRDNLWSTDPCLPIEWIVIPFSLCQVLCEMMGCNFLMVELQLC